MWPFNRVNSSKSVCRGRGKQLRNQAGGQHRAGKRYLLEELEARRLLTATANFATPVLTFTAHTTNDLVIIRSDVTGTNLSYSLDGGGSFSAATPVASVIFQAAAAGDFFTFELDGSAGADAITATGATNSILYVATTYNLGGLVTSLTIDGNDGNDTISATGGFTNLTALTISGGNNQDTISTSEILLASTSP